MEVALVAVRSEQDHLQEPSTFTTSGKMDEYLNLSYNTGIDEIAMRYESYVLSGVHGKHLLPCAHNVLTPPRSDWQASSAAVRMSYRTGRARSPGSSSRSSVSVICDAIVVRACS